MENGGESWIENGAFDASASFSQDWLGTDGASEAVVGAPRVVGRLPNLGSEAGLASSRRDAKTIGVALASFGFGVVAALGGAFCFGGFGADSKPSTPLASSDTAPIDATNAKRDFAGDSLAEITSSTLRSVPENAGDVFDAPSSTNDGWRNHSRYNDWSDSATTVASPSAVEKSTFSGQNARVDAFVGKVGASSGSPASSAWGSVGDFERDPAPIVDASSSVLAEQNDYPTWEDLEADVAPRSSDVASNYASNAAKFSGFGFGQNVASAPDASAFPVPAVGVSVPVPANDFGDRNGFEIAPRNAGVGVERFATANPAVSASVPNAIDPAEDSTRATFAANAAYPTPPSASHAQYARAPQNYVAQTPAEVPYPAGGSFVPVAQNPDAVPVPATSRDANAVPSAAPRNLRW